MSKSDQPATVALTEGLGLEAANRLELLAHSGGLRGPADAWTMLRSGIATEIAAAVAAERERCARLPPLPRPRVLASGTIAGRYVDLQGWYVEDIEAWAREHGLRFGA